MKMGDTGLNSFKSFKIIYTGLRFRYFIVCRNKFILGLYRVKLLIQGQNGRVKMVNMGLKWSMWV